MRTTTSGINVCSFTVAVNRRRGGEEKETDFFQVTAWRERGETCAKFLRKGSKVCVIGPVSVRTYTANNGETRAQLEITADEVEFCSSRVSDAPVPEEPKQEASQGFTVVETDELPF